MKEFFKQSERHTARFKVDFEVFDNLQKQLDELFSFETEKCWVFACQRRKMISDNGEGMQPDPGYCSPAAPTAFDFAPLSCSMTLLRGISCFSVIKSLSALITAGMKAAVDFRGKFCLCQLNQIDMTVRVNVSSLRME